MLRFIAAILFLSFTLFQKSEYTLQRTKMVEEQIIARGVKDAEVIAAMMNVPRHKFVPAELKNYAYSDQPLPIGHEQTISQPYIVAYMTEQLQLKSTHTVLEIGTGSGYQAAVLAEIVSEVISIEIVEPLALQAQALLHQLSYKKITVIAGDGYQGYPNKAPYDAIIVTAAPNHIPPALVSQLKNGGRMIIPVGEEESIQQLMLIEKRGKNIVEKRLIPVRFVPFTGKATEQ